MFNKGSCGLRVPLPFFPLSRFIYQCRHWHWLAKILFKIQINRHLLITIFFSSRQLLAPFSTVSLGKPPASMWSHIISISGQNWFPISRLLNTWALGNLPPPPRSIFWYLGQSRDSWRILSVIDWLATNIWMRSGGCAHSWAIQANCSSFAVQRLTSCRLGSLKIQYC